MAHAYPGTRSRRRKIEDPDADANPGPSSKRRKIEYSDKNCRLRHGLNVGCLVEIFEYLDCDDLWTLRRMNNFYKQIINNFVIQKVTVKGSSKFWERHGKQIRKFQFSGGWIKCRNFVNKIIRTCDEEQLKVAEFVMDPYDAAIKAVDLSINHFRKLETLLIRDISSGYPVTYIFPHFEALRVLSLYRVQVPSDFDWMALLNLTELELNRVIIDNKQRFIDFIHERPKFERFVHMHTFRDVAYQTIAIEMIKYCGDRMYAFHDFENFYGRETVRSNEKYNFLAGFKYLKEVSMAPKLLCQCDIMPALALLAKNDTLEKLSIVLTSNDLARCGFSFHQNGSGIQMGKFSRLKTIHVHDPISLKTIHVFDPISLAGRKYSSATCENMKLFTQFSSELLSNVETFILSGNQFAFENIDFLENALKLRTLSIFNTTIPFEQSKTFRMFSIVRNILEKRSDERRGDGSSIDFIEMIVNTDQRSRLESIENIGNYIKFRIKTVDGREMPISDDKYKATVKNRI